VNFELQAEAINYGFANRTGSTGGLRPKELFLVLLEAEEAERRRTEEQEYEQMSDRELYASIRQK
jgi:hypothetical protein